MILKDGTHWEPKDEDVIAWQHAYPDCDVYAELAAMESWADANPSKRKTRAGAKRFVNAWLNRTRAAGGQSPFSQQSTQQNGTIVTLKQWTTLDDQTHDFMQSEAFRRKCLAQFGQYVSFDGQRVTNVASVGSSK